MQDRSADSGRTASALGVALLAVVLLVAATACGSRVPAATSVTAAGTTPTNGTGATADTSGGSGTTAAGSGTTVPAANMVGTLKSPCSATKGSGTLPAGTPGVTADKITVGIISDKANAQIPVPTIGIQEGLQAFVNYCNSLGGINGRQIVLKAYDAAIFKTDDVTKQACNDNLFALVGDGAVQDQLGIATRDKCGLPEVAAYSATTARSQSKDFFQPVPGTQAGKFNVGPCKYIKSLFPDAVAHAAVVYTNVDASSSRALATAAACETVGFKFPAKLGVSFGATDFQAIVGQMKSEGIKYVTVVSVVPDTLALLREMKAQNFTPEVIDLGQQYYADAMAAEPAANGAFVLTNTAPFFEAASNPALQVYETWRKKINGPETSLGVQAFSAGLLFAQAAESLGNNLTRASLLAALRKIHSFDAGGMQMVTNPGRNVHNSCFLYLKIVNRTFVRQYPKKGFSCDPADVISIPKGA